MAELPEDVIADILTCAPVKPLLRFRCLSKHFRALIDSSDFIKRHLNRSIETKTNHKLILREVRHFRQSRNQKRLYSVDLDELDQALELDHPCGTKIIGSVNGILCLYDGKKDIVLWNLATRKYQKLHVTEIEFSGPPSDSAYGFGYDSVSDDYKFIWLVEYSDGYSEAKVYSLRSNSWQRIKDSPSNLVYGQCYGVQACGAMHWVVSRKPLSDRAHLIVAFDLAKNEYRQVNYPEFLDDKILNVINFEGRLCMMCKNHRKMLAFIEVWVMKDYGVKESWNKLFRVSQTSLSGLMYPFAISKSGTEIMLLQNDKRLFWYSLKEETVRPIHLHGYPDKFVPEICMESLVPLSGKAEDYAHTKKDGKGAKKRAHSLISGGSK